MIICPHNCDGCKRIGNSRGDRTLPACYGITRGKSAWLRSRQGHRLPSSTSPSLTDTSFPGLPHHWVSFSSSPSSLLCHLGPTSTPKELLALLHDTQIVNQQAAFSKTFQGSIVLKFAAWNLSRSTTQVSVQHQNQSYCTIQTRT